MAAANTDDGTHAECKVKQVFWFFIGFLAGLLTAIFMFYVTLWAWYDVPKIEL